MSLTFTSGEALRLIAKMKRIPSRNMQSRRRLKRPEAVRAFLADLHYHRSAENPRVMSTHR